jgi:hypothetical protein
MRPDFQFHSGSLDIAVSLSPESPILDAFYRGYDEAFVLPNEKEELAGFRACLALNSGAERQRLGALFGDFHEAVLVAREPGGTNGLVGGANFICYPILDAASRQPIIAMNLNYVFVTAGERRKGYLAAMLDAVRGAARRLCDGAAEKPVLIFLEQNDPVRMGADDYARDTAHTGLDQRQRIAIWAKHGARIVDYPYVQPPLSPEQAADDTLIYTLIGAASPQLPACLLRDHLERFFTISVLKGKPLAAQPVAQEQIDDLSARCGRNETIALFDSSKWLAEA